MINAYRKTAAPPPRWVLAPAPGETAHALARDLGLSAVTAGLLVQRLEVPSPQAAQAFLRPSLGQLHGPWQLQGMREAAARIVRAIEASERIVIYGDYDTDGVTATAVLARILQQLGCRPATYLPSRLEEGYGLSDEFIAQARTDGTALVITVDCGITEHDKIAALTESHIDVIVTDHHEPGASALPAGLAVVNPKRTDQDYPFRELTGVGVVFKLAWAVCETVMGSPRVGKRLQEALLGVLPLVALGTIADVAPLVDENRILVAHGLQAFRRADPGLAALAEVSGVDLARLTVRDVAFGLAPRLNAAGRLGDADAALHLLLEDDPRRATGLARELDRQNRERQKLCQQTREEALSLVRDSFDPARDAAIVVAADRWHEGVVGIVAGRLAEEFHRPAVVIALLPDEDSGKGSARSIEGLNLYEAMSCSRQRFLRFGGHEQAAGFSIPRHEIDPFRSELNEACHQQMRTRPLDPTLPIDGSLDLAMLTIELLRELERLAPFGCGNPRPRFLARGVRVAGQPRLMGREQQHFSFNASQNGVAHRAVVFNNTEWLREIDAGKREWDIVFAPTINEYRATPRVELKIEDMRPC